MFQILISDKLGKAGLERLDQMDDVHYEMRPGLNQAELRAIIPDYDALIVRSDTQVTAELLAAAPQLKIVGRAGIGVDNIDIKAATMRGIIVMNTPGANSMATAEQTMALMLASSRHTAQAHMSVNAGEWRRSDFVGTELFGKTLGIIGFGRIGRLVAARAQAFGMEVVACDPFVSEEVGREMNVTLLDLEDLLPQADYVSLHTAVTPETTKLINTDTINQMKDGVILINVARGKLIDEPALAAALQSGKVRAAGLDVYSSEPPTNNPLIHLPNVVHTPHLGASSVEAQRNVATQIVEQVVDALRGTDFRNALNTPFQTTGNFDEIRPYMALAEKIGRFHAGMADSLIQKIELEVQGEQLDGIVKAIAAGLLIGVLQDLHPEPLNYINAPVIADQLGIQISQTTGQSPVNYPNLVSCRVFGDDWDRLIAGVLFAGGQPRIVRLNDYDVDARPEGHILLMQNRDVPGVVGQIGTILAAYEVNIGEWRMGRDKPGGKALSFINLDSDVPAAALDALSKITAVTRAKLVNL
ncbi:MAG: phosphoglycerate dehydrogenase [Ardenticatenaceae bacterium]|nr:phosphoglycerate dehydrogenase [Ardenticatenaceae bacterium]